MYLVKDLDQIHPLLLTTFCLYFGTEGVFSNRREVSIMKVFTEHLMSYLKNLRTREAELPQTQLNPSAGSGIPHYHVNLMSSDHSILV
jgi:hypothetical protein